MFYPMSNVYFDTNYILFVIFKILKHFGNENLIFH